MNGMYISLTVLAVAVCVLLVDMEYVKRNQCEILSELRRIRRASEHAYDYKE